MWLKKLVLTVDIIMAWCDGRGPAALASKGTGLQKHFTGDKRSSEYSVKNASSDSKNNYWCLLCAKHCTRTEDTVVGKMEGLPTAYAVMQEGNEKMSK